MNPQAVAALDENPDTKVEAVHLAIALAYHGLLRVPPMKEASDYEIRKSRAFLYFTPILTNQTLITQVCLSDTSPPALNFAALIHKYVRPFTKLDSQHALQYVACICLSADQGDGVGKEQVEYAWSEIRKIIVLAEGAGWDELVGGLRPDGTRYVSRFSSHFRIGTNDTPNSRVR